MYSEEWNTGQSTGAIEEQYWPEFIHKLKQGDSEYLERLVRSKLWQDVYGFLSGVLKDREEAANCMQDLYLVVAEKIGQCKAQNAEAFSRWMFKCAYNKAMERYRKTSKERHSLDFFDGTLDSNVSSKLDPVFWMLRKEYLLKIRNRIDAVIRNLESRHSRSGKGHVDGGRYQEIVMHRFHDGRTLHEIAEIMNVPSGTILARIQVFLDEMRRTVDPDEFVPAEGAVDFALDL